MPIHSMTDAVPPARYDEVPWVAVRVEESSSAVGPWALADTVTLDPLDTDPASPAERSFTFTAEADTGWFRLVWTDGNGDASPPSEAVLVGAAAPDSEAIATLRTMTEAGSDPLLSDAELDGLLNRNAGLDREGREPTDADWTPTYALGAAAADAWLLKAGKVAARVDGGSGGLTLARSQLYAHCMEMADRYSARRSVSLPLAPGRLYERLPVFNRNDPYLPDLPGDLGGAV